LFTTPRFTYVELVSPLKASLPATAYMLMLEHGSQLRVVSHELYHRAQVRCRAATDSSGGPDVGNSPMLRYAETDEEWTLRINEEDRAI